MARPALIAGQLTERPEKLTLARDGPARCRKKFLRYFPRAFEDARYIAWERGYKAQAHALWQEHLNESAFRRLLAREEFTTIAQTAARIESPRSLLFSFEKMALRDAVRSVEGAQAFSEGLFDFLHGAGDMDARFSRWVEAVSTLPRKQTRVLTWPLVTVFGFLAQPKTHLFLKPNVTRRAATAFGVEFRYESTPNWQTYAEYLAFARQVRRDISDLHPRDMIDIQSFLWVQGSDEYA